jgi:hypothetical protein
MNTRILILGAALLAPVSAAAWATPPVARQDQEAAEAPAPQHERKDVSASRQAIAWSQDKLVELDATIAVVEKDAAKLKGKARADAAGKVAELKQAREAYRLEAEEAATKAKLLSDAKIIAAREALDARRVVFDAKLEAYLDSVHASVETRRSVLQAQVDARQAAWQKRIDRLDQSASRLSAAEKSKADARIAELARQKDQAKHRAGELKDASKKSWAIVRRNADGAEQLFLDTYRSVAATFKNDETDPPSP